MFISRFGQKLLVKGMERFFFFFNIDFVAYGKWFTIKQLIVPVTINVVFCLRYE